MWLYYVGHRRVLTHCYMARSFLVLAADDEETDRLLLKLAFQEAGLEGTLMLTRDGQEALDYLDGEPPYQNRADHPLPSLFLLDLKMPRLNGFEVLASLAQKPELQDLPVVVLSSSMDEADLRKARRLGADEYLVKPTNFQELTNMVRALSDRWLGGDS